MIGELSIRILDFIIWSKIPKRFCSAGVGLHSWNWRPISQYPIRLVLLSYLLTSSTEYHKEVNSEWNLLVHSSQAQEGMPDRPGSTLLSCSTQHGKEATPRYVTKSWAATNAAKCKLETISGDRNDIWRARRVCFSLKASSQPSPDGRPRLTSWRYRRRRGPSQLNTFVGAATSSSCSNAMVLRRWKRSSKRGRNEAHCRTRTGPSDRDLRDLERILALSWWHRGCRPDRVASVGCRARERWQNPSSGHRWPPRRPVNGSDVLRRRNNGDSRDRLDSCSREDERV